jgi:hypothetical protein
MSRMHVLPRSVAVLSLILFATVAAATPGVPHKPTNCNVQVVIGLAVVSWEDRSDNETGFEVEAWVKGIFTPHQWVLVDTRFVGPNATVAYFDVSSSPSYPRRFRVRAVNSAGASGWSSWAYSPAHGGGGGGGGSGGVVIG